MIRINPFVLRQTANSPFSHHELEGGDEALIALVSQNFNGARPGYRPEVLLVPVPPEGFFTSVVQLSPGDVLSGSYTPRREGEEPRKRIGSPGGQKMPARSVEIVLYHASILGEDATGEEGWEIISINASPWEGPMPIDPETLIANHFEMSGGTATGMSDAEFVAALRESVMFWKNKALLA
jgi:hypothetical protein